MTKAEIEDCAKAVRTFIPPAGIRTTFNGEEIRRREPLATVEAKLPTEVEDEEGRYRPTIRKTGILVYEPLPDEKAMIYEMGLPVIETGDRWHYDIQQRIPLTSDRDHVRAAFLQDVRAEVANAMVSQIRDEDASAEWVRDASADDRVTPETLNTIAELRWGEKRTVAAPGDSYGKEKAIAAAAGLAHLLPFGSAHLPGCNQVEAAPTSADYEQARKILRFNAARLGKGWFAGPAEDLLRLVIHELAHEFGGHISEAYYEGLSTLGAKLALCDPQDLLDGMVAGASKEAKG